VVDDRIEVAELAQDMLESLGYRVRMVNSANEALQPDPCRRTGRSALHRPDHAGPHEWRGTGAQARRLLPSLKFY
jgi:hypothetical protein